MTAERRVAAGATTGRAPTVAVDQVSKTFRLPHRRVSTLKERVLHPFESSGHDDLHALRGVSFDIAQGEFFGIVGRNGSGKSTLLKCMAGIYDIDDGTISMHGRVAPFIELGVGFNPELTARDNVIINSVMLGLTRKQARERFDGVIAFAELEQFLDLKLKNYSSGMNVRLAFSTAITVDADILLIDEVLAVGDAAFQQKCFDQFRRLQEEGRTIIFVTHDMGAVERFCDRAMLVEQGEIIELGEPARIARRYNEVNFGKISDLVGGTPDEEAAGRKAAVRAAWFEDETGERVGTVAQRESVVMRAEVEFRSEQTDPVFLFVLRNEVRHIVFATSSTWELDGTGTFGPGDVADVAVELPFWLAPGRYDLSVTASRAGGGADVLDLAEDVSSIIVHGQRRSGGVVDIPHDFRVTKR
jgi:ABC-type polysaccharide/polyol phosphate transport system ATPase subunit